MVVLDSIIGNSCLLVLESSLILFTVRKLFNLIRQKEVFGIQKKLSSTILKAYTIVFICLAVNIISQVNAIFKILEDDDLPKRLMDVIFESLPTILLYGLILTISFFWLELRVSFEDDTESVLKTSQKLKYLYLIANLGVLVATTLPGTLYFTIHAKGSLKSLFYILFAIVIFSTGVLIFQGQKFYKIVIKRYAFLTIAQKKRFIVMFFISLGCLLIKIANFLVIIFEDINEKKSLMLLFFDSSKDIGKFGISGILYVVGEFGSIISFLVMIQCQYHKQKSSMVETAIHSDFDELDFEEEFNNSNFAAYHDFSAKNIV